MNEKIEKMKKKENDVNDCIRGKLKRIFNQFLSLFHSHLSQNRLISYPTFEGSFSNFAFLYRNQKWTKLSNISNALIIHSPLFCIVSLCTFLFKPNKIKKKIHMENDLGHVI